MDFNGYKSGFVTLVGRPNAGKSTLLNAVMGKKIAITSNTAQTTRHRFRAVKTTDAYQLVIVDTPGIHKPHDALGEELNTSALKALEDVDVVAMLVDASQPVGTGDEWVARQVAGADTAKVLVLSKTDLVDDAELGRQRELAMGLAAWDDVVTCSATTGEGVDAFVESVVGLMPEGPRWFPEDMDCDATDEDLVAEFVREKLLNNLRQEVPHSVGVICDDIDWSKDHASISATIIVEREGQKGIVIGHGGKMIKKVGTEARRDIERLFDCSCYLDLQVRVKPEWRRDQNEIRRLGYEAE